MTFRQTVKRFFEPAYHMGRATFRAILWYTFINIQAPINVFFIGMLGNTLETSDMEHTKNLLFIYIGILIVLHIILEYIKKWGWAELYFPQQRYIQDKYLKQFSTINGNYIESVGTGKLISIMSAGFERWSGLIESLIGYIVGFVINFIAGIYFALNIGRLFGIGYVVLFLMVFSISIYLDKPAGQYRNKRRDVMNEYSRGLVRFIMSRNEIIQSDNTNYEVNRIGKYVDQATEFTMKQVVPQSRMYNIPRLIIDIFRISIYIIGGKLYFDGTLSLGSLTAMLGFMLVIDQVIMKSIQGYKDVVKNINIVTKLWETFDTAPKMIGLSQGGLYTFYDGSIELNNVEYSYKDTHKVFDDFSLKLSGGQQIALVGPSGGGKSTLMKLISGYIYPQKGKVLIDTQFLPNGRDQENISLQSYYKKIAYLTQEPSVFDGTIYENLTYALSQAGLSDDELKKKIQKVIVLAKCEFIYDFEFGLQTEIGERGIHLSGGQKQRLAIAKIMLKDPQIILLDEPTSALDSFNEELITQAMQNLFKNRTVIIIAHRLQTVKNADRILYIEGGKVIEDGTHTSLIKKNGKYKKMLDLQSGF
ncbi:Multidrug resistance ABC transporter ATP-binding and permease protein [candidate division SR1 bacterium Aalborg_AAW-1]|nr:Multidrug resistance ABC transporter ATP-binding and permease protein [candidate division SR1 bacterium Aalborg_AAW-1]